MFFNSLAIVGYKIKMYICISFKNKDIMTTILGFTDKHNTCDCCGKSELKGTYSVIINDNEFFYGSTCVKRNLGLTQKEFLSKEKKDRIVRSEIAKSERILQTKELEFTLSNLDWESKEHTELCNQINEIRNNIALKYNLKYYEV